MKRAVVYVLAVALLVAGLASCTEHDSDVVSENLSTAADQFEIARRIVFYNGITGDYMLSIEGLCALGNHDTAKELTVVCKVGQSANGEGLYKKHFLGLSDNVTYFVEQIEAARVSAYHYRVIFKPSTIIPDVDVP